MSANHGCSAPKLDKLVQHAATAPMLGLPGKQAVSHDLAGPMEEDDGQEVAADNQLELQQHAESMDISEADQQDEADRPSRHGREGNPWTRSDRSFDFEKKLMPPASKQTADSPASMKDTAAKTVKPLPHKPSVTADPDTESEDLVLTDTSDSDSDPPAAAAPADSPVPQIACSDAPLTSLLAKADAVAADAPVLSASVAEKLDEGINHIIKVKLTL